MNINFVWINEEKMPPPCVEKKNWVPQFNGYPLIEEWIRSKIRKWWNVKLIRYCKMARYH